MTGCRIHPLTPAHASIVLDLYRAAASIRGSGLARAADEITMTYVRAFMERACLGGVSLGAFRDDRLVGEIHAARLGPRQFDHVLGDLTIAVHPQMQGQGVGSVLFAALFDTAASMTPAIGRVELTARSGNTGALRLYERLGFVREGRLAGRVRLPDGTTEDDIPMGFKLDRAALAPMPDD
ncbi:GNAT family N-acetyltransferase [Sphingomonas cynarae]|uniref:GNAT family N-acetyltransferase n=1 Tax=Sphingomonas cynarae TaxID=930197 RepID=A0ABP7DBA4_9SPHN